MVSRCPREERWTRKKRSDWMLKCIDTFLIRTHIIFSLSIRRFRENILSILPSAAGYQAVWNEHRGPRPGGCGTKPAAGRQIKSASRPSETDNQPIATEGSTNRQRPRLLLGRSVCYPRSNVASEFFKHQLLLGLLIFPFSLTRRSLLPTPTMLVDVAFGLRRLWGRPRIFSHARNLSAKTPAAKVFDAPLSWVSDPIQTGFRSGENSGSSSTSTRWFWANA